MVNHFFEMMKLIAILLLVLSAIAHGGRVSNPTGGVVGILQQQGPPSNGGRDPSTGGREPSTGGPNPPTSPLDGADGGVRQRRQVSNPTGGVVGVVQQQGPKSNGGAPVPPSNGGPNQATGTSDAATGIDRQRRQVSNPTGGVVGVLQKSNGGRKPATGGQPQQQGPQSNGGAPVPPSAGDVNPSTSPLDGANGGERRRRQVSNPTGGVVGILQQSNGGRKPATGGQPQRPEAPGSPTNGQPQLPGSPSNGGAPLPPSTGGLDPATSPLDGANGGVRRRRQVSNPTAGVVGVVVQQSGSPQTPPQGSGANNGQIPPTDGL